MNRFSKKAQSHQKLTVNGFTSEKEKELRNELDWAMKYGKRYASAKEMHEDILKDSD